jgi:outer membrane protein assembly factor BamB
MAGYEREYVFIGIKGTALALERTTGREVWRTTLKGSDFVNLVLDGDELFATARGEVFCLDPATGRILWNNPLKGLGWGLATVAGPEGSSWPVIAESRRRSEEAGAASSAH